MMTMMNYDTLLLLAWACCATGYAIGVHVVWTSGKRNAQAAVAVSKETAEAAEAKLRVLFGQIALQAERLAVAAARNRTLGVQLEEERRRNAAARARAGKMRQAKKGGT